MDIKKDMANVGKMPVDELEIAKLGAVRLGECPGRLDMLEKLVGQPADEYTKPLFEILVALNKEILSLNEEVQQIKHEAGRQSKILQDEIDRRRVG
ncbi:MAG: hypothetical protein Q8S44_06965 [Flavobacteriaceae bacterium]|uniref:Uncharacterized protein n=1 Tax=viral metagenome TaxID=1070528 RepID=A0A6M3Y274_9ZZZZ|nr:hypothetical protein [Flavobacteriaceae bacterium]